MTFFGESVPVEPVFRTTGDYVDGLRYRAGSALFADGESFRAWVQTGDTWYLWDDPTADVAVSWVVEVLSGSGTLTLSEGTDPAGGFGSPPATPTALGAHAVTGPTTLVVASATFDGAYVLSGSEDMVLRVDVTGGTVEIQQVKLRVWPVAGAAGGWSSTVYPSWLGGISFVGIVASVDGLTASSPPMSDGAAAFAAAWAALAALPQGGPPWPYVPADESGGGASGVINIVDLDTVVATIIATSGSLIASPAGPSWPVESGVTAPVPPNEVRSDPDGIVQQVGAPALELFDWSLAVRASSELPLPDMRVHTEVIAAPDDITTVGPNELDGITVAAPAANTVVDTTMTIPEPDVGEVLHVSGSHTGRTGAAPLYPSGVGAAESGVGFRVGTLVGEEFTPATSRVIYPPYRVWDPAAAVMYPLRLMQRGDGLGMGSGRVFGAGTRQGSIRVFGSI